MKKDSSKKPQFSLEQFRQVLSSPEGKRLMELLNRDGGQRLQQAAAEFKKGNTAGAKELLKPVVENPETEELLEKINRK